MQKFPIIVVLILAIYLYWKINNFLLPAHLKTVHPKSFAAPGYESVIELFQQRLNDGSIRGGSFSAYEEGKLVVDVMGGAADIDAHRPWTPETMTRIFSVSKLIAGLCVALLVQRKHVVYTDLVSKYWSEFAQNGKEAVTVDMLLTHRAGLENFGGEAVTMDELAANSPRVSRLIEMHRPNKNLSLRPEDGGKYHILTYGILVDQFVRRADPKRRSLAQFLFEEILVPLKLENDLLPAIDASHWHRMAHIHRMPDPIIFFYKMFIGDIPLHYVPKFLYLNLIMTFFSFNQTNDGMNFVMEHSHNNLDHMSVPQLSYSVVSNSRALARLLHMVALGGSLDGVKLFEPEFLQQNLFDHRVKFDPAFNPVEGTVFFARSGFIYDKPGKINASTIGGSGYGGQRAVADHWRRLSYAYISNHIPVLIFIDSCMTLLGDEVERASDRLHSKASVKA